MQKSKIKNQNCNLKIKIFEFYIVIFIFAFCILNLIGCAGIPVTEKLPPYKISKVISPTSKIRKIVIDPGHGGHDPGAIGRSGLREKVVTLDIAKRLSNILKSAGFDIVLTRSTDRYITLESRVSIANKSKADLFISIHANANRVRSLNGFEVYYVANNVNDSQRAISTAKNAPLDLDKSCFASSSLNLKAILWDMIYTNNRAESVELGRCLSRLINSNLDIPVLGVKGGRFKVLKDVRIPAVLVEVGFLSNTSEEQLLKNNYYRQRIALSLAEGIGSYAQEVVLAEAQ